MNEIGLRVCNLLVFLTKFVVLDCIELELALSLSLVLNGLSKPTLEAFYAPWMLLAN